MDCPAWSTYSETSNDTQLPRKGSIEEREDLETFHQTYKRVTQSGRGGGNVAVQSKKR
jgi:hypothetical protein